MTDDLLRVGVISSAHGVRGEAKIFPTTDNIKRFSKLKKVIIDNKKEKIEYEIESVKYFKQFAILKFKGIDNRDDIEKLKGMDLLVTRDNAVKLAPNENFICDLVGCKVITDESVEIGTVTDVLITGANDVYVIENNDGKEILLPVIKDCVKDVDVDNKRINVHLLPGLLDIYLN